jgi:hypothetical protein
MRAHFILEDALEEIGLQDLFKAARINRNLITLLNRENISEIIIQRLQSSIGYAVYKMY